MSTASTPPIIEMVTDINTNAVRVTWSQPAMPNGIISLYTITYTVDGDSRDVDVDYSGEVCNYIVCNLYYIVTAETIL